MKMLRHAFGETGTTGFVSDSRWRSVLIAEAWRTCLQRPKRRNTETRTATAARQLFSAAVHALRWMR